MEGYRPRIVCFSCNFGWGYLADRPSLAASVEHWVPVACSGKVDATHILQAFRQGADGVLVLGCPDGECHFQDGNYQTRKKIHLLRQVLGAHGVDPARLRMVLAVDPDGKGIGEAVAGLAEALAPLGPVRVPPAALAVGE